MLYESLNTRDEESAAALVAKPSFLEDLYNYCTVWTEDGIGLGIAMIIFGAVGIISESGKDITKDYTHDSQWPLGALLLGFGIIVFAHKVLNKDLNLESYCAIMIIAVVARSIGNYDILTNSGLSASLWAILIGTSIRTSGLLTVKGVFSGEFFVKIGVTLMAMDYTSIVKIGLPGLMIAWGDTFIILVVGVLLATKFMKFSLKDAIVITGATSICGSSAATAISSSIHDPGYKDDVAKSIIAFMGVFNAPLMPIMPLAKTLGHLNPAVVGAWIGGSIDSTGQVTASAQMGGDNVLEAAIIIKMAQNILIGPLCLLFTSYFRKSFDPNILVTRFPLFVVGFLLTSMVATAILQSDEGVSQGLKDTLIPNSWCVSEFITLIGFACIGLEIDLRSFFSAQGKNSNILMVYLMIQTLDVATTFGWSYLMFHNRSVEDNDGDNN